MCEGIVAWASKSAERRLSPSPSRGASMTELRENFVDGLLCLGQSLLFDLPGIQELTGVEEAGQLGFG
jgi:hypothetical protein